MNLQKGSERAPDPAWPIAIVDVESLEGLEILIGGIVAVVVIAVIVIPLLLFGIELIIVGLVVAGGAVARSAFGRPWVVQAAPNGAPTDALAWEVKGWRRSAALIDEVAAELAAGLTPSPPEDSGQVKPEEAKAD